MDLTKIIIELTNSGRDPFIMCSLGVVTLLGGLGEGRIKVSECEGWEEKSEGWRKGLENIKVDKNFGMSK